MRKNILKIMIHNYIELNMKRSGGCSFTHQGENFFWHSETDILYRRERASWVRFPKAEIPQDLMEQVREVGAFPPSRAKINRLGAKIAKRGQEWEAKRMAIIEGRGNWA